ncbi:hypothetical protein GOV12_07450 [Candidatus Pacearchaeota archaeon]|nr:hypothetical protein [Candidatus Pacearchaeota archaeon]
MKEDKKQLEFQFIKDWREEDKAKSRQFSLSGLFKATTYLGVALGTTQYLAPKMSDLMGYLSEINIITSWSPDNTPEKVCSYFLSGLIGFLGTPVVYDLCKNVGKKIDLKNICLRRLRGLNNDNRNIRSMSNGR